MRVVFALEARDEVLAARDWYEARAVGLGLEFARALDAAMSRLERMPRAFPEIAAGFQHVALFGDLSPDFRRDPRGLCFPSSAQARLLVRCQRLTSRHFFSGENQ